METRIIVMVVLYWPIRFCGIGMLLNCNINLLFESDIILLLSLIALGLFETNVIIVLIAIEILSK